MIKPLLLSLVLALAACSSSDTPPGNGDASIEAASTGDGGLGFGAHCTTVSDMSTECASGVCTNSFDQLGTVCSQKCTVLNGTDPSCPVGSMGQKCNMRGYCRP